VNVRQLQEALQAALDRGLSPDTTVVIEDGEGWYNVLDWVDDPTTEEHGSDMWFTLFHHEPADSRFTPGGHWPEEG
jgi:hypothetical protein